jgi:DNA invertase Pin-like site-specific DNA recombinase
MKAKAFSYIRFSTPEQLKGDSLRRQLEASRKYALDNDLDLDESLQDLGVKAFHGLNRLKGALGRFLQLVKSGRIARGSYLIVENLDRLSREDVDEAYDQFRSIIKAGITIVTLQDGIIYSESSIRSNWAQLIISITYMARAHDESKRKSERLSSAWVNKRAKALNGERILTFRCPAWLRKSEDGKSFVVNDEAAKVINVIFDMKIEGRGVERIARELNQTTLWKPQGRKGKAPSWRKSYLEKILYNNRALIGEYQPHKMVNGKRVPEGDPILKYYPIIVDEEKFYRVQSFINDNRNAKARSAGRNDKVSNLFGHMAVCMDCGYSMQFINKGYTSKGGQYLACDKEVRKIDGGCRSRRIRYNLVEENILLYCIGLEVEDIIPSSKERVAELGMKLKREQSINGELIAINDNIEKLLNKIQSKGISLEYEKSLDHRVEAHILRKEKLITEQAQIIKDIERLSQNPKNTEEQLQDIKGLIDRMNLLKSLGKDEELLNLRLNLRSHLRRLIKRIYISSRPDIGILFQSGQRRTIGITDNKVHKIFDD